MKQRKFAVFDIDGTLIRWQLYHSIVTELARQGCLSDEAEQAINQARMTWKERAHHESFREYEETLVHVYLEALSNTKPTDYLRAVDVVFEEYKDQVYAYTRNLVRSLKADGYYLLTISGSQEEIIAKLAGYYGFDDYRGAKLEQVNGHFTGTIATPYGRKGELLQQMVQAHGLTFEGSIGVGDSESDIDMLKLVEKPIAFNPTSGLFEHAKQTGWQIVVERKNVVYELKQVDGTYLLA